MRARYAVIALIAAACGGSDNTGPPPPPVVPPPAGNPTVVTVGDNTFSPGSVTIARGGTVRWVNQGQVAHNSTSQGVWGSPNLAPGQTFEREFPAAGTFNYACTLHAGMTGTVVVQ